MKRMREVAGVCDRIGVGNDTEEEVEAAREGGRGCWDVVVVVVFGIVTGSCL